jgi:hypothetical protein
MARRGAGTDMPPENPRRVIGLFNMAAVCLIGSVSDRQLHDPELARSPTVFGNHSRGHLGRFLTDFLFAP